MLRRASAASAVRAASSVCRMCTSRAPGTPSDPGPTTGMRGHLHGMCTFDRLTGWLLDARHIGAWTRRRFCDGAHGPEPADEKGAARRGTKKRRIGQDKKALHGRMKLKDAQTLAHLQVASMCVVQPTYAIQKKG